MHFKVFVIKIYNKNFDIKKSIKIINKKGIIQKIFNNLQLNRVLLLTGYQKAVFNFEVLTFNNIKD